MLKIALTGADGLVGSRIVELLQNQFQFIPISQKVMDITDRKTVNKTIDQINFDLFLHLAAYTNVDAAEQNKKQVYEINRDGVKNVFQAVTKKDKKLIYISTDFVFDGKNLPYDEDSLSKPLSVYGDSKYEGERVLNNQAMIVRIAYPYRSQFQPKKDFFRNILDLLAKKLPIKIVNDMTFTPTFIDDIAYGLAYLFNHYLPEIYHLIGSQILTPYQAGQIIAQKFNYQANLIQPVSYKEYYKNRAIRPRYSHIISRKNNFHRMKSFEEGLEEVKKQLN